VSARLAVLLSGSGRSLANMLARCADGTVPAQVGLVVANRSCGGLEIAREHGVHTELRPGRLRPEELLALVRTHAIDWVLLAGYLQLVPVPAELAGRIVNIHPALLPAFGGTGMHGRRVHEAVVAAAARGELGPSPESGCTVHYCDDRYDTGPIILQRRVPVFPDDTPDALAARVFEAEQLAYPEAVRRLIEGTAPRFGPNTPA
jgi:phosphoribosylglycinamide formyltransferase-1